MITPGAASQLVGLPVITLVTGNDFYEIRRPMRYQPVPGTRAVTITTGDTLRTLALQHYGELRLWWAIADFNGIFDVTTELTEGRTLLIPPRDFIEGYQRRA